MRRQKNLDPFRIDLLDRELSWKNRPQSWETGSAALTMVSGPGEDWFLDPSGLSIKRNAPCALFAPMSQDFMLRAKVTVHFQEKYDAGTLHIQVNDDLWAKLCFEYSNQHQPTIVSVVTRGTSDDCNSTAIEGNSVYLRVSKIGKTFAFHYSLDGQGWNLVRYFALGGAEPVRPGFSVQSPIGVACSASFSEIAYTLDTLDDIRSGK